MGWPEQIPFGNFNSICGGNVTLHMLIHRCKDGKLKFKCVIAEDIALVECDLSAVLPSTAKTKPHLVG